MTRSCELLATGLLVTTAVGREKLRPRLRAAAPSRAEGYDRSCYDRLCYDRASRASSIAAASRRRATPCAAFAHSAQAQLPAVGSFRVPRRPFHSTTISPFP